MELSVDSKDVKQMFVCTSLLLPLLFQTQSLEFQVYLHTRIPENVHSSRSAIGPVKLETDSVPNPVVLSKPLLGSQQWDVRQELVLLHEVKQLVENVIIVEKARSLQALQWFIH